VGGFLPREQDLAAAVLGFELEELEAFGASLAAFNRKMGNDSGVFTGELAPSMTHRVSSFFFSSLASTASVGMRLWRASDTEGPPWEGAVRRTFGP